MNGQTERRLFAGPVGAIDVAIDRPAGTPRGLALVAHPHPLFGGTLDNKVAQTLARAFVALGYIAIRPNFRGVGKTEGVHDEGRGETEDLLAVLDAMLAETQLTEVVLGGFSFGSYVQTFVAEQLAQRKTPAKRLVLVGLAVTRGVILTVPPNTLVIHGERDETVPLSAVLDWAATQDLPIVVVPATDHFFHRRLPILKALVLSAWQGEHYVPVDVQPTHDIP